MRALTGQLEPGDEPENLAQAMALFSDFYSEQVCVQSQLYAGVKEGLERLQAAKIKLACVTNKPARFTLPLLTEIGLKDYFQLVVSGDTFYDEAQPFTFTGNHEIVCRQGRAGFNGR